VTFWEVVKGGGVDVVVVVLVVVRRVRLRVVKVVDQQLTLSQTCHPPNRGRERYG